MSLESLIQSTGLEKHILRQDLYCAVNRFMITGDETEMEDLTRDQLIMYLDITRTERGGPLWKKIEEHLGETLP